MRHQVLLLTTTLALTACGGRSPQTTALKEAVAAAGARRAPVTSVAFRFAGRVGEGEGAAVRMYRLPTLDEVAWRFDTPGLHVRDVVGLRADYDEILLVTPSNELVVLDLDSGRPRKADTNVTRAALGPMGTPILGRSDGTVAQLEGRKVTPLLDSLEGTIEGLWGAIGGRVLVVVTTGDGRELLILGSGQDPSRLAIPQGPLAIAPFGDAVAVATDSGIVVITPGRDPVERFVALHAAPVALTWSASAHRIYVATGTDDLVTIERFLLAELGRRPLPLVVSDLRIDPAGRMLLGRALLGDTVLIVSLKDSTPPVKQAGTWDDDLPAVAWDGTVLLRRGNDIVALEGGTLERTGRTLGGARDRWLIAHWDPRRPALQLADEARAAAERKRNQRFYLQVSSTSNLDWAEALARDLRRAGMKSAVLPPDELIEMYRVVIGPYPARDQAEEIGRTLGMPYFIFTETPPPDTP